jgi:membrane protein implicated in regulation of membrane protease activity
MVRDFLLLLLGLDIGTASPHLAVMANAVLTCDWSYFMSELRLAMPSFIIEAIVALIILYFLQRIDKKNEQKEQQNTIKNDKKDQENTEKIVEAIRALGDKIDGKSITDKPKQG